MKKYDMLDLYGCGSKENCKSPPFLENFPVRFFGYPSIDVFQGFCCWNKTKTKNNSPLYVTVSMQTHRMLEDWLFVLAKGW